MNRKSRALISALVAGVLLVLFAETAFADAGVPMIAVVWPLSWIAFIPIVAIETAVAKRIASLSWRKSLTSTLTANLASTFIGIPITWGLLVVLGIATGSEQAFGLQSLFGKVLSVTIQAAWLIPYESDLYWMVPAAVAFLLPFFGLASVFIERPIFRKLVGCDKEVASSWSWKANLITYGIQVVMALAWFVIAVIGGPKW